MKPRRGFYDRFYVVRAILISLLVLTLMVSGCGTKEPKVYRVGVLCGLKFISTITDSFKEGMAELGYVEGENIIYDVQETDFDMAAYQSVLQKFVADKVDLILTYPTEATIEAKAATEGTDIPVAFVYVMIEGTNLVNSVREPGGNITGVRYPVLDIAIKRFEILHAIVPDAKRIWIPYMRDYPIVASQMEVLYPVAEAQGITLIEFPASTPAELKAELDARAGQDDLGIDAILFISEPLIVTPDFFVVVGEFAQEHKIPFGGAYVEMEGYTTLFGVVPNVLDSAKQTAFIADKILKGVPAGTIPVVSPENFVQINYKATQALGVTVPENLLTQANEIIR